MDDGPTIADHPSESVTFTVEQRAAIARMRALSVIIILTGMAAFPLIWLNPHPASRWVLVLLALAILAETSVLLFVDDARRLEVRWVAPLSAPAILGGTAGAYFIGFFSPVIAVNTFAICVIAQGPSRRVALYLYVAIAVTSAIAMLAIAFEILPDIGLLRHTCSKAAAVATSGFVQMMYFSVFLFGRKTAKQV